MIGLDESTVVALASIVFVLALYKKISFVVKDFANNKIKQIEDQIEQSRIIKEEALVILAKQQELLNNSDQLGKKMLAETEQELLFVREKLSKDLEQKLTNKLAMATRQIKINQYNLISKIRKQTIAIAVESVIQLLNDQDLKPLEQKFNHKLFYFLKHTNSN